MQIIYSIISAVLIFIWPISATWANDFNDLIGHVEKLNISRSDYTLGKALTDRQKNIARANVVEKAAPGTYKFKDKALFVVVDQATDRVVIFYEHYEPASKEKIQELVGDLFLDLGAPTVMAHEKTVYWAFDEQGKLTEKQYRQAKRTGIKLGVLATVKLNSSVKIMTKSDDTTAGSVYYIISSEPLLKLIKDQRE